MKKVLFSFAVLIAALVSCSKEQNVTVGSSESAVNENMVTVTFSAGVDTKTHLATDHRGVIWQKDDKISVFANGNNYQFSLVSGADSAAAEFQGEMTESDAAASVFYALYPYDANATINGDVITAAGRAQSLPYFPYGGFANGVCQSVAKTSGSSFDFKLICSLVTFTVPTDMAGLLKQVMFSTNAGASSEPIAGGTLAITVGDEPSVVLSGEKKGDTMMASSTGLEATTYYFPVYPTALSKGFRLKLEYLDGRQPEYLFTGKALSLERAKVLNIGTLHPQPSYIFEDFEHFDAISDLTLDIKGYKINGGNFITGNDNAIKVVENPYKTEANPSDFVLANDMHTAGWSTSGYVQLTVSGDAMKVRFPYAARDKFKAIRMKVYIGSSEYYPTLQFPANGTNGNKFPSKVNDVLTGGSDATYASALKHDDWNLLEFNLATCAYTSPYNSNFASFNDCQFRPFVKAGKGNCDAAISDTNLKLVYIDDIEFLYK